MINKIVTTYENKQIELVFNESFLCPHRDVGIVDIQFGPELFNWTFRIVFKNDPSNPSLTTNWEYSVDNVSIKVTLNNWLNTSWLELTKPKLIYTKDSKKTFYFKLRSEANSEKDFFRQIHISIWKVI